MLVTSRVAAQTPGPTLNGGFTLVELLVAITVMALLAVLSWRGLDGMARAQGQTSQRADQILTLQAGLAQWRADLDTLTHAPQVKPLDWDGRVLRLTRRTATSGDGVMVVAWTRRAGVEGQWLRWQSPVLRSLSGWADAWARAGSWGQNADTEERPREVKVTPLDGWQIFYFRGNAWSHPMSSAGSQPVGAAPAEVSRRMVPDGIRLMLTLPDSQAISGTITMDWVRPTLGGDKP